jgi:hypothetical protein
VQPDGAYTRWSAAEGAQEWACGCTGYWGGVRGTGKAVGVGGAVESEEKRADRGCVGEGAEGMEKV